MVKYGVFRFGGNDRREYATYLPLKNKLIKHGGDLLFSESNSGTGIMVGWNSSQNIQIKTSPITELIQCDVIDFADMEIYSTLEDESKKMFNLIDIIPDNVKIIVTVYSPESLKGYNDKIKNRVGGFVLKWRMPIPAHFPIEKIYYIKHAVYTDFWKPNAYARQSPMEQFNILYTAQINYTKGFAELIQAFFKANKINKNIKLGLAGYDPAFAAYYYSRKFPKDIYYSGYTLRGDDILEFLNNGKVFCQPDYTNQGSHSALEAMSCGLPCLAIDNGYSERENIDDGKTGYLCKDWEDLSEKFIYLNDNPDLTRYMAKNSREKAVKEYSCKSVLHTTLSNLKCMGIDI